MKEFYGMRTFSAQHVQTNQKYQFLTDSDLVTGLIGVKTVSEFLSYTGIITLLNKILITLGR